MTRNMMYIIIKLYEYCKTLNIKYAFGGDYSNFQLCLFNCL